MLFQQDEAVSFASEALGISSPLEKISRDPYLFLKDYFLAFLVKAPFQSISLLATVNLLIKAAL